MDARVQTWLARDPDPATRAELEDLVRRGERAELERAFAGRLAFGTAGLRGVIGVGPARMNRLVVRETTAGLAHYLVAEVGDAAARGVVIGYDGRTLSRELAHDTAVVLAALGIKALAFTRELPTPLCAFAVRELGAAAGVMVTASHNPPEYNGYKVYWENGAQIIPPHDGGIAQAIDAAAVAPLPWCDAEEAKGRGLIVSLGDGVVDRYLEGVRGLSVRPHTAARAKLRLAYTPLHGVGAAIAERALAQAGFTSVRTVASQRDPDPRFPTVRFPNPEEPGAMDAVLALAGETSADLALANDPDADRLAVAARRRDGTYRMLTGNEIGAVLGWDQLEHAPERPLVVTTIVSSRLLSLIARAKGAGYAETLTGFKWIANEGFAREARGERFVFGFEEALGYTIGGLVRDKDGISALVAFAELAASLADEGETVLELLARLAREHGLHVTAQRNLPASGGAGPSIGERLRRQSLRTIGGRAVVAVTDVLARARTDASGRVDPVSLPASDVLVFELAGEARIVVRPSGTEPKIKCYYELREEVAPSEPFAQAEARAQQALAALIAAHQAEVAAL